MKPKTISEILGRVSDLSIHESFVLDDGQGSQLYESDKRKIVDEALAQIQQLLEGCAPPVPPYPVEHPENIGNENLHIGAVTGFQDAIDQYKSNIRGKMK